MSVIAQNYSELWLGNLAIMCALHRGGAPPRGDGAPGARRQDGQHRLLRRMDEKTPGHHLNDGFEGHASIVEPDDTGGGGPRGAP